MARIAVLVLLLLSAAACESGTEPKTPPLVVYVTGAGVVTAERGTTADGRLLLACPYSVTAMATGGATGDAALWTGATFAFRHQDGRQGSYEMTGEEVAVQFGGQALPTGASATSRAPWYWIWDGPFVMDASFHYQAASNQLAGTAVVQLDCR
ncbi:MAG TPA: hypothetical protein VGX50_00900 [Longimicrobium sp.]|jgi:hypothetical protein|nr:hypothetical protein [Longimicrobium sp.]